MHILLRQRLLIADLKRHFPQNGQDIAGNRHVEEERKRQGVPSPPTKHGSRIRRRELKENRSTLV